MSRVLFSVKRLLDRLLLRLATSHERLAELTLRLRLDRAGTHVEQIRPAAPTVDVGQLMNLIRLRLESLTLRSGIIGIRLVARVVRAQTDQPGLFVEQPRRDVAAADRALASYPGGVRQ